MSPTCMYLQSSALCSASPASSAGSIAVPKSLSTPCRLEQRGRFESAAPRSKTASRARFAPVVVGAAAAERTTASTAAMTIRGAAAAAAAAAEGPGWCALPRAGTAVVFFGRGHSSDRGRHDQSCSSIFRLCRCRNNSVCQWPWTRTRTRTWCRGRTGVCEAFHSFKNRRFSYHEHAHMHSVVFLFVKARQTRV